MVHITSSWLLLLFVYLPLFFIVYARLIGLGCLDLNSCFVSWFVDIVAGCRCRRRLHGIRHFQYSSWKHNDEIVKNRRITQNFEWKLKFKIPWKIDRSGWWNWPKNWVLQGLHWSVMYGMVISGPFVGVVMSGCEKLSTWSRIIAWRRTEQEMMSYEGKMKRPWIDVFTWYGGRWMIGSTLRNLDRFINWQRSSTRQ